MSEAYSWRDIKISIHGQQVDATEVSYIEVMPEGADLGIDRGSHTVKCNFTSSMPRREWESFWHRTSNVYRNHHLSRHKRNRVRKRLLRRIMAAADRKAKRHKDSHRRCYNEYTIECSSYVMNGNTLELTL